MLPMSLLSVSDLHVGYGATEILRGVSFELEPGETLGVVGESGCGKSMTGFAIMGMLQAPLTVSKGSIKLEDTELVGMKERDMRKIRGQDIALVMQDPFTSLNPMMRIADQIAEAYLLHEKMTKKEAYRRAVDMLDKVGVPAPESSARKYPHQLSGGMNQRVAIARTLIMQPKIILMDEPFGALDPTTRQSMQDLLVSLWRELEATVFFVTHDIAEAVYLSDRMYIFSPSPGTIRHQLKITPSDRPARQMQAERSFQESVLAVRDILEKLELEKAALAAKGSPT